MKTIPVAIHCRVSTRRQETDRQEAELREVAAKNGWEVVEVILETISGRVNEEKRADLARIRALAASGRVQKVIVHEVSRISRKNSVTHKLVEDLTGYGVSLYWHAQKMETLLDSGATNPAASMMLALLAEIARNESCDLSRRILSGQAEARRKGVRFGRAPGFGRVLPVAEFKAALEAGESYRGAAARLGHDVGALRSALRRNQAAA